MTESISSARLSELVAAIYDCALDPGKWPVAMEAIRKELNGELASMSLQALPSFELIVNVTTNLAPPFVAIMRRAGSDFAEPWGGEQVLLTVSLDEPAVLSRVNPSFDPATERSRYYHEFAKPQGLIDILGVGLARDAHGFGSLAFGRHERWGRFTDREVEIARLLVPHLQRAATINRLLDRARAERDSFAGIVDALATPVVLVGIGMEVVHANTAAKRMLDEGGVFRNADGILQAVAPGVSQAILAAIAAAPQSGVKLGRKGLGIPVRTAEGAFGSVYVLPLGHRLAGHHPGAVAGVFLTTIQAGFVPPADLAAALFDLTPSEARVFDQLATGRSLKEVAARLGVATSTAKTHMLRLHDKMGVSKRGELMRIAAALAMPIAL